MARGYGFIQMGARTGVRHGVARRLRQRAAPPLADDVDVALAVGLHVLLLLPHLHQGAVHPPPARRRPQPAGVPAADVRRQLAGGASPAAASRTRRRGRSRRCPAPAASTPSASRPWTAPSRIPRPRVRRSPGPHGAMRSTPDSGSTWFSDGSSVCTDAAATRDGDAVHHARLRLVQAKGVRPRPRRSARPPRLRLSAGACGIGPVSAAAPPHVHRPRAPPARTPPARTPRPPSTSSASRSRVSRFRRRQRVREGAERRPVPLRPPPRPGRCAWRPAPTAAAGARAPGRTAAGRARRRSPRRPFRGSPARACGCAAACSPCESGRTGGWDTAVRRGTPR